MGSFKYHQNQRREEPPGKIESPLNKKLENVKWGEFKLGDLFEILTYKKRFDANKVELVENCGHPYVVRTSCGNGQKGFINEDEVYLNEGNTISFGQDTATMYYQEVPYFTGDKIKILKSKLSRFGKTNAQFFLATMRNSFQNFTWGSSSFNVSIIANQKIQLPLKEIPNQVRNNSHSELDSASISNIDFDFMESFIRELEEERIRELNAYLLATGLKDYALSNEEENALESFKTAQWGEFNLENLYGKSTRGKRLKGEDRIKGNLPFVTAGEADTGISAYISNGVEIFSKNTTTIDMFGSAKYRNYNYGADDHVAVVHTEELPKHSSIFVTCAIHKSSHTGKFDYSNNFYASDADELNIQLPTKDGKPDYATMETFIKAVEKLVIKDVVLYADKKIKATKEVVSENSFKGYPKDNPNFGLLNVAQSR